MSVSERRRRIHHHLDVVALEHVAVADVHRVDGEGDVVQTIRLEAQVQPVVRAVVDGAALVGSAALGGNDEAAQMAAKSFGIEISSCAAGKKMGLCAEPAAKEVCALSCGECEAAQ